MESIYDLTKDNSVEHVKPAERNNSPLLCPNCNKQMISVYENDCEIDTCEVCQGIWVDINEQKDLINPDPEVYSIDDLKEFRKKYKPLGKIENKSYVKCPVCQELMHRRNWGTFSGVIVDKCSDHGTWYDKGELEKIREFVALGGIEFEKFRTLEKGIDKVNHDLCKEVFKLDQRITSAYRRARLYSLFGL